MEVKVKIYREEENIDLLAEDGAIERHEELMKELGLTIPVKKEGACPGVYTHLNSGMTKQLVALVPTRVPVEKYTLTTIPLEVLEVLKFAKDQNMYEGYEIWSANDKPDPILVGWNFQSAEDREKNYTWRKERYLMARWGDCALELPELCQLGFDRLKEQLSDKVRKALINCNAILANPDTYTRDILAGTFNSITLDLDANNTIY